MFDIGFSEVLVIFVIALVVLGPEKLPRLASQVGRWIGRARAMARQFREQLEEEVNLEQVRRAHEQKPQKPADTTSDVSSAGTGAAAAFGAAAGTSATEGTGTATAGSGTTEGAAGVSAAYGTSATDDTGVAAADASTSAAGTSASHASATGSELYGQGSPSHGYQGPDPAEFRADTFSHAHPTNEVGANPDTVNGAPPLEPVPVPAEISPAAPTSATHASSAEPEPPATQQRTSNGEAYASNTPAASREPTTRPATEEAGTHGQS